MADVLPNARRLFLRARGSQAERFLMRGPPDSASSVSEQPDFRRVQGPNRFPLSG